MKNRVLHKGSLIELHAERVPTRSGETTFDIVKHPGGAVILAINDDQQICLLRQWRHALQTFIWELPAGCLEEGESALKSAQRELEEEAGVRAEHWNDLGQIFPSPGYSNEILYLFSANGIQAGESNLDDAEQIEAHWLKSENVKEMVKTGEIQDAKTLAALAKISL